jgi:hypothetical protein
MSPGKSTLLKIMTGDLHPVHGSVRPHAHLRIAKFTQHFIDVSLSSLSFLFSKADSSPSLVGVGYDPLSFGVFHAFMARPDPRRGKKIPGEIWYFWLCADSEDVPTE